MNTHTIRVWDLPTRLFHWSLVACVIGVLATAWAPGSWIEWHARLGYAVLALLAFRLLWGLVGGRWSRFAALLHAPARVVDYLRGRARPDHLVGHNPLGAASVLAMLAALLVQVGTGLVSDDEIAFQGPLNRLVDTEAGLAATAYHADVGQWLLVGLIGLHIAAVLFYQWRRKQDLVGPMLRGDKVLAFPAPSSRDDIASRLAGLGLFTVCAGAVWWLVT